MVNFFSTCFKPTRKKAFSVIFVALVLLVNSIINAYISVLWFKQQMSLSFNASAPLVAPKFDLTIFALVGISQLVFYLTAALIVVWLFNNHSFNQLKKRVVVFLTLLIFIIAYIIINFPRFLYNLFPQLSGYDIYVVNGVVLFFMIVLLYFLVCLALFLAFNLFSRLSDS